MDFPPTRTVRAPSDPSPGNGRTTRSQRGGRLGAQPSRGARKGPGPRRSVVRVGSDRSRAARAVRAGLPTDREKPGDRRTRPAMGFEGPTRPPSPWLKEVPNPATRRDAIQNLMYSLGQEGSRHGRPLSGPAAPGESRQNLLGQMARNWADNDIEGAIDWVKGLPEGRERNAALENMTWSWVDSDNKGAAEFAATLPPGDLRQRMLTQAAGNWAARNPGGGRRLRPATARGQQPATDVGKHRLQLGLTKSPGGRGLRRQSSRRTRTRRRRAESPAPGRARTPRAPLEWVQACPAGRAGPRRWQSVLNAWAAESPREAAEYIAKLPAGLEQERGTKSVISSMVTRRPAYTANWISQFPEGRLRDEATQTLVNKWAREDPVATANWLNGIPAGQGPRGRRLPIRQFLAPMNPPPPGAGPARFPTRTSKTRP